ncbi:MAG: ABC transporter permease [Euryarchaeota archaeon]|nr:ABC transporter permease [Euryarchaeota archaeon]
MKKSTFLVFTMPSFIMMTLFIALPLLIVLIQSFQFNQDVLETIERENCDPFGCKTETITVPVLDENGNKIKNNIWVGFQNYKNILKFEQLSSVISNDGFEWSKIRSIDFYKALRFTLTFTFITLPFVIILGLILALCVNVLINRLKGPIIFITLLPFIITPVIGALSIKWLFIGDGILTLFLENILDKDIALFSQGWTIEILMLFYRVWHTIPFAFVIFYAGLQTVDKEKIEAAFVDGANRLQRLRFIIIPHIMPLIVFVALIHLMDSYRVFDEIVGFSASGFRISLQWMTYDFLRIDDSGTRSIGRASATSVLTMIGIIIILIPVLRRTFKEQKEKKL